MSPRDHSRPWHGARLDARSRPAAPGAAVRHGGGLPRRIGASWFDVFPPRTPAFRWPTTVQISTDGARGARAPRRPRTIGSRCPSGAWRWDRRPAVHTTTAPETSSPFGFPAAGRSIPALRATKKRRTTRRDDGPRIGSTPPRSCAGGVRRSSPSSSTWTPTTRARRAGRPSIPTVPGTTIVISRPAEDPLRQLR